MLTLGNQSSERRPELRVVAEVARRLELGLEVSCQISGVGKAEVLLHLGRPGV
jgi:hypothetical protein